MPKTKVKRDRKIVIAVTEKEKELIMENADNCYLTVSEYLRTLAIYGEVK